MALAALSIYSKVLYGVLACDSDVDFDRFRPTFYANKERVYNPRTNDGSCKRFPVMLRVYGRYE